MFIGTLPLFFQKLTEGDDLDVLVFFQHKHGLVGYDSLGLACDRAFEDAVASFAARRSYLYTSSGLRYSRADMIYFIKKHWVII